MSPGATTTVVRNETLPDGTTVNSGESMNLGGVVGSSSNNAVAIATDELTIDGGTLNLEHARKNTSASQNSVQYLFNSKLALDSGTLNFGAPSSIADRGFGDALGIRIQIEDNFSMSGNSSITNQSSSTESQIWLRGAQNTIGAGSIVSPDVSWVLNRSQAFRSAVSLGSVTIRTSGGTNYSIGHTDSNETLHLGSLSLWQQTANRTASLSLESNVTLATRLNLAGAPSSGTTVYEINTNGYTLDMAADGNRWKPDTRNNNITEWRLQGGGEIRAASYDLSTANANIHVGSGVTLRATKKEVTNILDSGTFDATSTFAYDADGVGYITATTTIGKLQVDQGQLFTGGNNTIAAAGGVVIEAGAGLGFRYNRLVTAPSFTFKVKGTETGRIVFAGSYGMSDGVDSFSLSDQNFIIEIGEVITGDQVWSLFDSQIALSGQLNSLTIAGLYSITDFTREGTNLVGQNDQWRFVFSEVSGELSVSSVIPEASTYSIVLGVAALGGVLLSRRLRSRR